MINESKVQEIIELALNHARGRARGTEVAVTAGDLSSSRFACNTMTQNQCRPCTEVSVRILKGGRQVRLTTASLSPQAIRRLVDDAIAATSYLEPEPDLLDLPGKGRRRIVPVQRYDAATARLSPAARAEAVARIIEVARRCNLAASGELATGCTLQAIGNSRGLYVSHRQSYAQCSITMTGGEASGWSKSHQLSFADLDVDSLALRAAGKAVSNVDAIELPPGRYRVILEPSAVLDLLAFLRDDFSATSYRDKLSCFLDKLGTRVFGSNINIRDDVYHPLQAGAPFDGEGQLRQAVNLVENGVVANLVYGRRSAAAAGAAPTGHGLPQPCSQGEAVENIVIGGGESSLEDMTGRCDRAILLTRVWYVREVDQTGKIVTGMTRDGTFLVRDGQLVKAVKNLRFNQSLIEMLNNVIALGPCERAAGEEGNPNVVPAMMIDNFNFASTTTF